MVRTSQFPAKVSGGLRAYQGLLREPFLFWARYFGGWVKRSAVFVDAGYLFAQGSVALTGSKKPRSLMELDELSAVAALKAVLNNQVNGADLLRIYWYDGANLKGPSFEHDKIGHLDDVKLRLGLLNSAGEQKGVDSLIVTDLIELARLGAIGDALLLSGDEDVRVGVQIAQNYGVRVHLLGIAPARGSQSKALLQEADTTSVWEKDVVAKFLAVKPSVKSGGTLGSVKSKSEAIVVETASSQQPTIVEIAQNIVNSIDDEGIKGIHEFWQNDRGVPPQFDGALLGKCRAELGRDLTLPERRQARAAFIFAVKAKGETS